MKLKYKVRELKSEVWAVFKTRDKYYSATTYTTEQEASNAALIREAHEINDRLNELQAELERRGLVDKSDPYGWRC